MARAYEPEHDEVVECDILMELGPTGELIDITGEGKGNDPEVRQ